MPSALPSSVHPTGNCTDRTLVARLAAEFGLEILKGDEIDIARAIGADIIGAELASAETLIACDHAAKAVVFGYREAGALTGMMALLPLNARGHAKLIAAAFDAQAPSLDLVARPGEAPAAYYAWGIAATSKEAARRMIKTSSALRTLLFWAIPTYSRAVTDDGLRLMTSFGYRPFTDKDPHLIMAPAPGPPKIAAA